MSNNIGNNQNKPKIILSNGKTFDLSKLDKLIDKSVSGSVFARYDNVNNGGNGDGIFNETEITFIKNKLMNYQNSDNSVSDNEISELVNGENAAGSDDMERMLNLLNELEGDETEVRSNNSPSNESNKTAENPVLTKYTVQPGDTPLVIAKKLGYTGQEAEDYAARLKQHFKDSGYTNSKGWLMVADEITLLGDQTEKLENLSDYSTEKKVLIERFNNSAQGQKLIQAQKAKEARIRAEREEQERNRIPDTVTKRANDIKKNGGTCIISKNDDGTFKIIQTAGAGYFTKIKALSIELLFSADGKLITQTNNYKNGKTLIGTYENGKMTWKNAPKVATKHVTNSENPLLDFNGFNNYALPSDNTRVVRPIPEIMPINNRGINNETFTPKPSNDKPTQKNGVFKGRGPLAPEYLNQKPKFEELTNYERAKYLLPNEIILPKPIQDQIIKMRLNGDDIVSISFNNSQMAYEIEYKKDDGINNNNLLKYPTSLDHIVNKNPIQLLRLDINGKTITPDNAEAKRILAANERGTTPLDKAPTTKELENGRVTSDKVAIKMEMSVPSHLQKNNGAITYANALESNKASLMKRFGITNKQYDNLAALAMGIAEQETHFGEHYYTTTNGKSTERQDRVIAKEALDAIWYGEYENSELAKTIRAIILTTRTGGLVKTAFDSKEENDKYVKDFIFNSCGNDLGKLVELIKNLPGSNFPGIEWIINKGDSLTDALVDYQEKIKTNTKSYGMTQAKIDQFMKEPAIASQLREYGITCGEDIRKDPEKQAIATMIILNNKRIIAESETWQKILAENNSNITDETQKITTNDLMTLLWNGNSKKLKSLKAKELTISDASYPRNVRAYTNHYFKTSSSSRATATANALGAVAQSNNGEIGSVIFLANKYKTDLTNDKESIQRLENALTQNNIPQNLKNALITAVKNGDIAFGYDLSESEAKSITANDVMIILSKLSIAKEKTKNIIDPTKIRTIAQSVQNDFRAEYLASRELQANTTEIPTSTLLTGFRSQDVVNERLTENSTIAGLEQITHGKNRSYEASVARHSANAKNGIYTGFAVQADLGINPYTANGTTIPREHRLFAEAASDVANAMGTGGRCLTGFKSALETAHIDAKSNIVYPSNITVTVKENQTFLDLAHSQGYKGEEAERFAEKLKTRLVNQAKIDNEGNLIPGKIISFKSPIGKTIKHKVKEGENLETIVRQYGYSGENANIFAKKLYKELVSGIVVNSKGELIPGKKVAVHQKGEIINNAKDIYKYFDAHPEKFEQVRFVDMGNGKSREINASDITNLPAGYIVVYIPGAGYENESGHVVVTNGNGQGYADEVDNLRWDDYVSAGAGNGKGEHGTYKIYRLKVNE